MTFDWNRARAFLVTAEEGSLSAAARALGLAQPTLGRQVAALEEELGVSLFERAGKGLAPTPAGLELIEHVREMGEAARRFSLAASGKSQAVEGSIVLAASEIYSAFLLPPIVARLRAEHPGIEVEIVASNALSDLRRREADIALRNTRPEDPELFARLLGERSAWLYAAPAYLDRIGRPARLEDLADAEFVGFDRTDQMIDALRRLGLPVGHRNFPVITANHLVQWELVKAGLGIGVFPSALGDAESGLEAVLPGTGPIVYPMWLTTHRDLRTSRRVRLVYDFVAEALSAG